MQCREHCGRNERKASEMYFVLWLAVLGFAVRDTQIRMVGLKNLRIVSSMEKKRKKNVIFAHFQSVVTKDCTTQLLSHIQCFPVSTHCIVCTVQFGIKVTCSSLDSQERRTVAETVFFFFCFIVSNPYAVDIVKRFIPVKSSWHSWSLFLQAS